MPGTGKVYNKFLAVCMNRKKKRWIYKYFIKIWYKASQATYMKFLNFFNI